MIEVRKILDQLKSTEGVIGCGVVSKDGRPVELRTPDKMNSQTVAIMAATVYGGSMTLSTEAGKSIPKNIRIDGEDFKTIIRQCGRRSLAIVMMDNDSQKDKVNGFLDELADMFTGN